MGSIFALPANIAATVSEKGLLYCVVYYLTYLKLRISRYLKGRRLNSYDFTADGDPQKLGFLAPDLEWNLDAPQPSTWLRKAADDVFFFGTNSSSEFMIVHISRQPNENVRCSLMLRLASGKKYSLPEEHLIQRENKEMYTFGSSRLKVQCLQPMRKWRIFFNGILKEVSTTEKDASHEFKHVRFSFIWTASSGVFDFDDDLQEDTFAALVAASARSPTGWPAVDLQRLRGILNSYEQPGMILGTYTVEKEQENELYLWGVRGRYIGNIRELNAGRFVQIYGQFQSGALVHLEYLNIPGISPKLMKGFVVHSNGFIDTIAQCKEEISVFEREMDFKMYSGNHHYTLIIRRIKVESNDFQKEYEGDTCCVSAKMFLNHVEGRGLIFEGTIKQSSYSSLPKPRLGKVQEHTVGSRRPLIVPFENPECADHDLTGGKGSSLGRLSSLSKEQDSSDVSFTVPKGIVVTTEAYKLFTHGHLEERLSEFERTVWGNPRADVNKLCERIKKEIEETEFPQKIADSIAMNLDSILGDSAVKEQTIKFAVRSSATGEDTEQMSAAGQMETFLGLRNLNQITDAIKKCWSSQFSFQAVEYKRRYGQILNTPMAVVVQQMVPSETAGVLFTCDPVTGNPEYISITANWGLGESVVSASAEPDTVVLKRSVKNALEFHSHQIGNKEKKIVMDDDSGTKEVEVGSESGQLCITKEMSLKLGQIALKVEEYFGGPRDIEWGIVKDKVLLLQARPVTSLDVDTDFEIKHMFDNFMRMEREYVTTGNIGEVMPGALSPLGIDVVAKMFHTLYSRQGKFRFDGYCTPDVPYCQRLTVFALNHGFLSFVDGFFRFGMGDPTFEKAMLISILGRLIDDSEITKIAEERHSHNRLGLIFSVGTQYKNLENMFLAEHRVKEKAKRLEKCDFPSMQRLPSSEILQEIGRHFHYCLEAMAVHINALFCSSNWNLMLLTTLARAEDDFNTDVYSDFAYLLSTCTGLESDVPAAIQKLGKIVSSCVDVEKFRGMSPEDALQYIQNSSAAIHFEKFLEKHGHRCLKEFDVQSQPWDTESGKLRLMKMLQSYTSSDIKEVIKKKSTSFSAIISHMRINLSLFDKFWLWLVLPHCRRGVRGRELSKSLFMKTINKLRKATRKLADRMVLEGYLPDKELLYYLCFEEINQLIKTRSPKLVSRAIRRQRVHPELERMMFPEICIGAPKPLNAEEDVALVEDGFVMQGVPVSQGIVKGTARVITDFEEVSSIQQGDILITYSTDIGWSPYFPLLAGVVTELGGLISHGAVVAREYGLPCVVGLHGATKVFQSGDLVILDGNKGVLRKAE